MTFKLYAPKSQDRLITHRTSNRPSVANETVSTVTRADIMAKHSKRLQTGRQATPTEESPAQAFHRLAQGRTNKACKSITLIAQLTGSAYESTDIQRRAIVEALKAAIEVVENVFEGKGKASDKFQLPS